MALSTIHLRQKINNKGASRPKGQAEVRKWHGPDLTAHNRGKILSLIIGDVDGHEL
jgi:hypothetical protein